VPFKGKEMKLKEVLINDKIPLRVRDQLPLLCDENNILWIIGSRRSNFGLITNMTKEILEVKVKKTKL
jgi:tRNA(Ile)-lysidine synthase